MPLQFFVDGSRRLLARSPNPPLGPAAIHNRTDLYGAAGSTFVYSSPLQPCGSAWMSCPAVDRLGFVYNSSDTPGLSPAWVASGDAVVLVFNSWSACRQRLGPGSVVEGNSSLMYAPPRGAGEHQCTYAAGDFPRDVSGNRWIIENAAQALDMAGEWYADRDALLLYYLALPGEDPASGATSTVLPLLPTLLNISGAANVWVENVVFEYFGHDAGALIGEGFQGVGALMISDAVNVTLRNVTVTRGGANGLQIGAGVAHVAVTACTVRDVGGHGIYMDAVNDAADVNVTHTTVSGIGHVTMDQPTAIMVNGQSAVVSHCFVNDTTYAGIQLVWLHGQLQPAPPGAAVPYRIDHNVVDGYGLGVLNDFGGIRAAVRAQDGCWAANGSHPGCFLPLAVEDNLVRGGRHYGYGAFGLYLDQATSGVIMARNIVADVGDSGVMAHCGVANSLVNNLFVNVSQQWYTRHASIYGVGALTGCSPGGWPAGLPPPNMSLFLANNVFALNAGVVAAAGLQYLPVDPPAGAWNRNLYFPAPPLNASESLLFPGRASWAAWQASGQDAASLAGARADPLLPADDPANYTLPVASPAWALGWQRIDYESFGP